MEASYPSAIKNFTTKADGVDLIKADDINAPQAEITAIETTLGTNPQGASATVAARLETLLEKTSQAADSAKLGGQLPSAYLGATAQAADSAKLGGKTLAEIFLAIYPVGSIYIATSSTDPGTLFGGTWERFAMGRTLIGMNESDSDFNAAEKYGGEKVHTLTIDEIPSHYHTMVGGYTWGWGPDGNIHTEPLVNAAAGPATSNGLHTKISEWNKTNVTGGSAAHNNMPPYVTCFIWRRTA